MRKTLSLLSALFILISIQSQVWFDVGFKGGLGTGILMNQNIWDDPDYNHRISPSYSFGAKFGINLSNNHEITFDFMASKFRQDFLHNELDSSSMTFPIYESTLSYNSFDYMILYRHNKDGRYMEIGPSFQNIRKVSFEDEYPSPSVFHLEDVNGFQTNMIIGFGAYFIGSENFGVTTGFRISYTLTDLISQKGQQEYFPVQKNYEQYQASHPLFICFLMEANFDFAYFAKAKCTSRTKLIFFQ